MVWEGEEVSRVGSIEESERLVGGDDKFVRFFTVHTVQQQVGMVPRCIHESLCIL